MAQNRNSDTGGKVGKKEEREEETSVQMEESTVREREKRNSKCESCVSKGLYDRVSIFLCLVCEIYVCAGCMDEHRSHEGMEMIDQNLLWRKKKPGIFGKLKKRVTKAFGLTPESERKKEREESERERMLGNFVDQLFSESDRKRKKELKKKSRVSICDEVIVKHELDRNEDCWITGLCGLENRRWVACDFCNCCIKILKLGSHVIQRYIRFVGAGPWDVTEIDLKQNSAEPSLVSGSSSGISGTDRADPDKQCLIAVTLPRKRQIMFIDVGKKPALRHKVLYTEGQCRSIQFYDENIFTLCIVGRHDSLFWFVYIKSTDGDTLHKFNTGIYGYFPFHGPYLAVVSGRVYLTEWNNNKVQCRNVEGQVIADITIEGSGPVGISVDPDNNVYVCAWRDNKVYILDDDLTQYNSVLDQTTGYVKEPNALCYYRDKLFISHDWSPSSCNFVIVVRLS